MDVVSVGTTSVSSCPETTTARRCGARCGARRGPPSLLPLPAFPSIDSRGSAALFDKLLSKKYRYKKKLQGLRP